MKRWILAALLLVGCDGPQYSVTEERLADSRLQVAELQKRLYDVEQHYREYGCSNEMAQMREFQRRITATEDEYANVNKQLDACRSDLRAYQLGPSMVCR